MVYRIRIFSNFCDSKHCKDVFERLCEVSIMENYGEDKEIFITTGEDFTHVIIINTVMPKIGHIPKNNVIGFAFEPLVFLGLTEKFVRYAQMYIGKYFIGDKSNFPDPFIERFAHMWHTPALSYVPEKNKFMSIMVSEKAALEGHIYRHKLINKILETDLPIDIYGRGAKYFEYLMDSRVKGTFDGKEPYENYQFHICIENTKSNHYFSEKITDALICGTTPVYLGCRNIDMYFPGNLLVLSGDLSKDIELLKKIHSNPENYKKKIDIEYVKNKMYLLRNIKDLYK